VIDLFEEAVRNGADKPALSGRKNGKWQTINFRQYYDQSSYFAQALISLGINKNKAVNILG
jgi:long-subunit acyl-CoA synthetase (AMP-forming)